MTVLAVRHTGIVVSNMETSLPFYRDLLGLEVWWDQIEAGSVTEAITGVTEAKLRTVKMKALDGVSIELIQYLNVPQPVPPLPTASAVGCSHAALQVENIDALYQKATAAGIRFHTPPLVTPGGKAKVTYCRDPEGVIIELVELINP